MQFSICKLRTHQWCFLLFNVVLFHALLFGADLVEEYVLQPTPGVYTNRSVLDARERARKLDLSGARDNVSRSYPIANRDACPNPDLFLLALVFSSPGNASQRDAVRATWANRSSVRGFPVRTLFFLGSPRSPAAQDAVLREAERHGDVVQGHAAASDSARSRTERTVLALRWVVTFCPAARFLLLAEEGVFVNLPALGGYLLGLQRHPEDLYLGRVVHRDAPNRDPSSPGYLPPALYPERYLPDYCSSAAFVLSQDVARKVYVASADVHAPVPADAYVGLCARVVGVVPVHSAHFSGDRHVRYNACCYRWLFSSAGVEGEELREVWREVGPDDGGCSLLETYYGLVVCKVLTYLDMVSFFSSQGRLASNSTG